MEARTTDAGETVYVAEDGTLRGSRGPFHVVYTAEEGDVPYGYLCSACGTLDNAMDTMGRIVCNECGNTRKPEEWDAVKG